MENKKIILITEDEQSLRYALSTKLINNGFVVIEAKNGEEGLMLALTEHPDLILLDLAMPKIDGMTMLASLRQDEWGKKVPVIILTNVTNSDEKIQRNITEFEPTYYFIKAEKGLEEIVEKIKERLGLI